MPKITVEYSANLTDNNLFEPRELLSAINQAMASIPAYKEGSIKSVARSNNVYVVGTKAVNRAFVDVKIEIISGRTPETKINTSVKVMAVLKEQIKKMPGLETQLSVDIADMDSTTFLKEDVI